jgi:hypothetical protein
MERPYGDDSLEEKEGRFNMGIRTLIRIDEIIFEINRISASPSIDKAQSQHIKFILVKQLQIRAAPLMPEEDNKKIKERIDKIKVKFYTEHNQNTGRITMMTEHYDSTIEKALDDIVEDIELSLQKEGCYFMPNKSEEALF